MNMPVAHVVLTLDSLLAFMPVILTALTSVVLMLSISVRRSHGLNATLAVAGLNVALLSVGWVWQRGVILPVGSLFTVDGQACLFMALILLIALACCTLAFAYMKTHSGNREELYLLLVLSTVGGLVTVCSTHLASLFIGIEILSVPLYGLVAYSFQRQRALEAGLKYLVLSAMSSAFLLFGMALLYAGTGRLDFAGIQVALLATESLSLLTLGGFGLLFVALAFKLSLVPFHLWTPDVYEGAPAPVMAFLATASKVAVCAALLRLLQMLPVMAAVEMQSVFMALAGLSILVGNVLALRQANLKRLLAYSSIAHFGYLMIAMLIQANLRMEVIAVYLVAYVLSTLAAMGVMTLASSPYSGADADGLHNYRGLFWTRPYLAAVLTAAMLSLAGVPMTVGFIGKFYVILLAVGAGLWWLLAILVLGSAIALYYYLRVIVSLFLHQPGLKRFDAPRDWGHSSGGMMLLLVSLLVLLLGVYPQPMLQAVRVLLFGVA